jgi:beta-galactosidase
MLKADRSQIAADGRDLAVITVEVQDQKGRLVPDACPVLTFTLSGHGRILGAGNGDPSYPGLDHPGTKDCHQFTIPAFNGLAQLLIQSTDTSGTLQLTCTAEGLSTSALQLNTNK